MRAAVITAIAALSVCTSANALFLTFEPIETHPGSNLIYSVSATAFSLSDSFDQHSDMTWAVRSVEEDSLGRIAVQYDYDPGPWDDYSALLSGWLRFESDDAIVSPIAVNFSGSGFFDLDLGGGCCGAGGPLFDFGRPFLEIAHYEISGPTQINDTFALFTDTSYFLRYRVHMNVEGIPDSQTPLLEDRFDSWDAYNAYIAQYGTSGLTYASARGAFDLNISPVSVPEPSTLALLGVGLLGLLATRGRRHARSASSRSSSSR